MPHSANSGHDKYWEMLTLLTMFVFFFYTQVQIRFQDRRITVNLQKKVGQYNLTQSARLRFMQEVWVLEARRVRTTTVLCSALKWVSSFSLSPVELLNFARLAYIQFQFSRFRNWIFCQRVKVSRIMMCPVSYDDIECLVITTKMQFHYTFCLKLKL